MSSLRKAISKLQEAMKQPTEENESQNKAKFIEREEEWNKKKFAGGKGLKSKVFVGLLITTFIYLFSFVISTPTSSFNGINNLVESHPYKSAYARNYESSRRCLPPLLLLSQMKLFCAYCEKLLMSQFSILPCLNGEKAERRTKCATHVKYSSQIRSLFHSMSG